MTEIKQDKLKTASAANEDTHDKDDFAYLTGFGNDLESSCLPGALPVGRNTPRLVPYNLYTEQLSGTAFTKTPRAQNRRTWLYRIQPSVAARGAAVPLKTIVGDPVYFGHTAPAACVPEVNALRWHPRRASAGAEARTTFVTGCQLMCHGGSVAQKHGLAIYLYDFNASMIHESLSNADGEFLIVPQQGTLEIWTELGRMRLQPTEIGVVPRGIVFSVRTVGGDAEEEPDKTSCKGYVLEVYGGDGFQLPELGPIGSNGLANARDFLHPTAHVAATDLEAYHQPHRILVKMQSQLFERQSNHSPYNVVAWHGNYLPYKYSLTRFCAVNSVSYDHLDPSIYTVLTCPSGVVPGTALADFVVFPPRVLATDSNTLRPPWFHRNTMSEYMGLIYGQYDAKPHGFRPGGASLHNCMTPHGPDQESYDKAVADECAAPVYLDKGMAFMFETYLPLMVAPTALTDETWRDMDYAASSWSGLSADGFTGWQALKQHQNQT